GPNCQGLIHRPSRLVATFSASARRLVPDPMPVAYVGQSGAIGGVLLDVARSFGSTLASWVTTGNQPAADVTELATPLLGSPARRSLALYLESVPDEGRWRAFLADAAAAGTAVTVLRAGRSTGGRRAVRAHTGSVVGDDGVAAFEAACADAGVVRVHEPAD